MFDINIKFDDMEISSINKDDILNVQEWINTQDTTCNFNSKPLDFYEFKERFLEYYISECEFFLKIEKKQVLIGVLKGRLEFKNPVEVWILYFTIDNKNRNQGIGTQILNNFMHSLKEKYGLNNFYTCVPEKEKDSVKFLNKHNFKLLRVSKGFYSSEEDQSDMYILNLQNY